MAFRVPGVIRNATGGRRGLRTGPPAAGPLVGLCVPIVCLWSGLRWQGGWSAPEMLGDGADVNRSACEMVVPAVTAPVDSDGCR